MSRLPEPQVHTVEAIYTALAREARGGDSLGVPMSGAAAECQRATWYALRWAAPAEEITGQKQRRFGTGLREEDRLLGDLERAGVLVERADPKSGRQHMVRLADGWLRGKVDGLALGIPEAPATIHVVETKSHNEKSFKELLKHQQPKGEGLRKSKPDHFAQVQAYMRGTDLQRCLYLAVNKNTEELYAERVEFDAAFADALEAKVRQTVATDKAPPRLHDDPASRGAFACAWCPAKVLCHEGAFARVNCRTCLSASLRPDAVVFCEFWQRELSYQEQQAGCAKHLFLPDLVPAVEQIDADADQRWVSYKLRDGSTWVDGDRGDA